jgi:hypothetical protein
VQMKVKILKGFRKGRREREIKSQAMVLEGPGEGVFYHAHTHTHHTHTHTHTTHAHTRVNRTHDEVMTHIKLSCTPFVSAIPSVAVVFAVVCCPPSFVVFVCPKKQSFRRRWGT